MYNEVTLLTPNAQRIYQQIGNQSVAIADDVKAIRSEITGLRDQVVEFRSDPKDHLIQFGKRKVSSIIRRSPLGSLGLIALSAALVARYSWRPTQVTNGLVTGSTVPVISSGILDSVVGFATRNAVHAILGGFIAGLNSQYDAVPGPLTALPHDDGTAGQDLGL